MKEIKHPQTQTSKQFDSPKRFKNNQSLTTTRMSTGKHHSLQSQAVTADIGLIKDENRVHYLI